MSQNRVFSIVVLASVFVLMVGPAVAQSPDFQSTITGSADFAPEGSTVSYEINVANVGGADSPNELILDVYLPSGVPCDVNAYLDDDPDANAAFDALSASLQYTDGLIDPNTGGLYFGPNSLCDGFLLQPQGLILPPGTDGTFSYNAVMPTPPFYEGVVHVSSATQDADLNFGKGGCSATALCTDHPCLGPRINTIAPITGTLELVNDGSADPSFGCNALAGFTAGNIALVDRGTCAFEDKVANAVFAGASAVIVANTAAAADAANPPMGYDEVLNMACTNFCSEALINIPTAFISVNDGDLIRADLHIDNSVTMTIGQKDIGNGLKTETYIWENTTNTLDDNGDNDRSSVTTTVALFQDGFETSDLSMWSYSTASSLAPALGK